MRGQRSTRNSRTRDAGSDLFIILLAAALVVLIVLSKGSLFRFGPTVLETFEREGAPQRHPPTLSVPGPAGLPR